MFFGNPGTDGSPCIRSAAFLAVLATCWGCTLVLDTSGAQCRQNRDCAKFPGAACDTARQVCIASVAVSPTGASPSDASGAVGANGAAAGSSGGSAGAAMSDPGNRRSCRVADGCTPCAPSGQLELLNRCSDVTCVAFDNHKRLSNLGPSGDLTPLP